MPQNAREKSDTSSLIKAILDGYPYGNAIERELLANSDDAGATIQTFTLDTRTHGTGTLIDTALAGTQGPALLAENNAPFAAKDWDSIRKIHGSSKTSDETTVGKYGLGFRACYHITDNPHILSAGKLMIFDPHEELSGDYTGGVAIDIASEGASYFDQLAAFSAAIPNPLEPFPGAVIRLPLRTAKQAARSRIKSTALSVDDIRELFRKFVKDELDLAMLFLKHISSIEFREITPTGEVISIGKAQIDNVSAIARQRAFRRESDALTEAFKCSITTTFFTGTKMSRLWRIHHSVGGARETTTIMSRRLSCALGDRLHQDKLFSHTGLAIPLDGIPAEGRLFTLLPLPLPTRFPFHLHGIFALTHDRQGLKNKEESGSEFSREKLLVEWNCAIFDEFVPPAWISMMLELVNDGFKDIWSAWPPYLSEEHAKASYWGNILSNILKLAVDDHVPIFPTLSKSGTGSRDHVALTSALIADVSDSINLLIALQRLGISIVQPPSYITHLLGSLNLVKAGNFLNIQSVYNALSSCRTELKSSSSVDKDIILEYLVLSTRTSDLRNIIGLPLVPLVNDSRVALEDPLSTDIVYFFPTYEEEELYAACDESGRLLSCIRLSSEMQDAFTSESVTRFANVVGLGPAQISQYLKKIVGHFDPNVDEVYNPEDVIWGFLSRFWRWMNVSAHASELLHSVQELHLLPTAQKTLRKIKSRVPISIGVGADVVRSWEKLGIHFLDPSFPSGCFVALGAGILIGDLPALLDIVNSELISQVSSNDLRHVRKSIIDAFRQSSTGIIFTPSQADKYIRLPIFSTRVRRPGTQRDKVSECAIGTAEGNLIYVNIGDSCPLPILPALTTYVDVSTTPGQTLALAINSTAVTDAYDELKILQMSLDNWDIQPLSLQDSSVSRIVPRLLDLPEDTRRRLRSVPFIPVVRGTRRSCPSDVIDPGSEVAPLYAGETGMFPAGRFASGIFLSVMQTQGFFIQDLTPKLVKERISFISGAQGTGGDLSSAVKKAWLLLKLLDKHWKTEFYKELRGHSTWLPQRDGTLRRANECRDLKENMFLFDQVYSVVDTTITTPNMRAALGWDGSVSFGVLISQFSKTLENNDLDQRKKRFNTLIKYFADLAVKNRMDAAEKEELKLVIGDKPWIPVGEQMVSTRHAILGTHRIDGPFKIIPERLSKGSCGSFLRAMGCNDRPTIETLFDELELLNSKRTEFTATVTQVQRILEEIATYTPLNHLQQRILVPDTSGKLRSISEIYYNDGHFGKTDPSPCHGFQSHPSISKSLASSLAIRFLSGLELDDDDEDEDEENMAEDLLNRINGVLHDYDIQYAANEFLANADDAKATEFTMMLDERRFEAKSIVSPDMAILQTSPALVLYNDQVFTKNDFTGLRRIGKGGKSDSPDTIGRYGLGALSLFHFTEIPILISGGYVMMLDPSGTYLPTRKGKPRTVLYRSLPNFIRKYPDQVAPFESLFGFSASASEYKGTLFRLPLKSAASRLSTKPLSPKKCLELMTSYFDLARNAFFFTNLNHISAEHCLPGRRSSLWSVSATRTPKLNTEGRFFEQSLGLSSQSSESKLDQYLPIEDWLITSSVVNVDAVPIEHTFALERLKLSPNSPKAILTVRMAFYLNQKKSQAQGSKYHLFSSLRLPKTTTLPLHLHAPFAIPSDRRSVVFDPLDSLGNRTPDSAYNYWLLTCLVPPLYLYSLDRLGQLTKSKESSSHSSFHWWPEAASDEVSREVVKAFYALVSTSNHCVCRTVAGQWIAAKEAIFLTIDLPRAIRRVLPLLDPAGIVDLPHAVQKMLPANSIVPVTAKIVKDTINSSTTLFIKHYTNGEITVLDIDGILQFLLENKISPIGLPLLLLSDNEIPLRSFDGNDGNKSTIFYSDKHYPNLFPPSRFLHLLISPYTAKLMLEDIRLCIEKFNANAVVSLCKDVVHLGLHQQHSALTTQWIQNFWEAFDTFPDPPTMTSLEDIPLVPTYNNNEHVSLKYCREANVLTGLHLDCQWLVPILKKLHITVLKRLPLPLSQHLPDKFSFSAFVKCMSTRQNFVEPLSNSECTQFADWIRGQLRLYQSLKSKTLPFSKYTISCFSIWPAQRSGTEGLYSARELQLLPRDISLGVISNYIMPDITVAAYTPELNKFMSEVLQSSPMTVMTLLNLLRFPHALASSKLNEYHTLLSQLIFCPKSNLHRGTVLVPNLDLTLVRADSLYDENTPVFAAAFQSRCPSVFVHSRLQDLSPNLSLQSSVTFSTFRLCAQAIHDCLNGSSNVGNIMRRAEVLNMYYNNNLPAQVMTEASEWAQLEDLQFIERNSERYRSPTYDPNPYILPLPDIVSPSQLVRREFEAVAWTQRALFLPEQPTDNLVAVNTSIGVPASEEVVAHLAVLALQIAKDHSGNASLLRDLQATYQWLSQNVAAASDSLAMFSNAALFLNVDDPKSDIWEWHSAKKLVLNLHYDTVAQKTVRQFLRSYEPLILGAGGRSIVNPTYYSEGAKVEENTDDHIRATFNEMRQAGELTDITIIPSAEFDIDIDMKKLRAHKAFLVATIPHMKLGLTSGMKENTSGEYNVEGSYYCACKILDYVYTGKISVDKPESGDEAMETLRDLLELLEITNEWDIQGLKTVVERLIAEDLKLIGPETYKMILRYAKEYQAMSLAKACYDFENENISVLRDLSTWGNSA